MIAIGYGWGPAVLDSAVELDFLRQGQKSFSNSNPYWIGGSVNSAVDTDITYSDYIGTDSGNVELRFQ